jgi:hypothetical protein
MDSFLAESRFRLATSSYGHGGNSLTWPVSYSGLTGPATVAHFHGPAPAGKAAGAFVGQRSP